MALKVQLLVCLAALFILHNSTGSPVLKDQEDTGLSRWVHPVAKVKPELRASNATSTTINWVLECQNLCAQGQGGILCNCDMIPVAKGH